jgi:hypothetical protein
MGSPEASIRAAFITHLQTFTSLPPLAMENMEYKPVIGTAYLRPTLLPGEPFQAEMGPSGQNWHVGLFQISIMHPAKVGLSAPGLLRDNLINHFKRGTNLTYGGITVRIKKAYSSPALQETDWLHIPISIEYHLLASN